MSGIVGSKINIRGSGIVAQLGTDGQVLTSAGAGIAAEYEDFAAGVSWQSVVTGSTMTAVAGNGYPINTSSNTCTITLPASASAGDTIIFADYARYWATNKIIIDSNGLNYQGDDDSFDVEYTTNGQSVQIVYADATKGWIPITDDDATDVPIKINLNGIFGFGENGGATGVSNLVSSSGVIATDVSAVGTARYDLAACEYGEDKGIFGFGGTDGGRVGMTNLVSSSGVIATDVSAVGTARQGLRACAYGGDKGIFAFGHNPTYFNAKNLVSNSGVVATDATGVGTARRVLGACEYSAQRDKGIFAYGVQPDVGSVSMSNLVSNTGVVATDVTGVGTARSYVAACYYGWDKGIFGYGSSNTAITNLVSNTGVIGTDVSGVGTERHALAACEYGNDKGIFAYGYTDAVVSMSNLVSNTGVVAADVTGVGTARSGVAACSYN